MEILLWSSPNTVPKWMTDQLDRWLVGTHPYLVGWLGSEDCGLTSPALQGGPYKWRMRAEVLESALLNIFINSLEEAMDVVSATSQMTPKWVRNSIHLKAEPSCQAGGMGQHEHD